MDITEPDSGGTIEASHHSAESQISSEPDSGHNGGADGPLDTNSSSSDDVIVRKPSMLKTRRPDVSTTDSLPKKTVSFSSTPSEKSKTIINAPDCLHYMQHGSELIKVRASGRTYKRTYYLDGNSAEIRWNPSSKKKSKARINLEDVKEVCSGKTSEVLRSGEVAAQYPAECAFSILYGTDFASLDLIAPTPDEANIWVTGLTCLLAGRGQKGGDGIEDRQLIRDRWLQEVFSEADWENKGFLDEVGVIRLMKTLNSGVATVRIRQKLKEADVSRVNNRGRLTSEEFVNLFKEISTRPEIYFMLVRYSSNGDYMSADDLLIFLEAEQRLARVTKEKCLELIEQHEPSAEGRQRGYLGIDGFTSYLLSEDCDIFDPEHANVVQDMDQPISHYFIASSHNTYLLEDQLKGPSSVEGYTRALVAGCRFVELDCWDGPNNSPIIYHGNTLTSRLCLRMVMEVINNYAFITSEYPVILSLENHCSYPQQQEIARILVEELGSQLCSDLLDEETLPSPAQLKRKFIIRGKKLSTDTDSLEGYVTEEDETADFNRERSIATGKPGKRESVKKHKLARELSDLVTCCQGKRFQDFQCSQQKQKPVEMCSMSESAALRLANLAAEDFVQHNKRFLTRVYPNPTRVDSSNYNPQDLWNVGCQVVSLNYQTSGLMMDLNTGFFSKNGRCGYVLKPSVMREQMSFFSLHSKDGIPDVLPQTLYVRIISGQQLPKPKGSTAKGNVIDPYVVLEVFGIPADCAEERTKTVPGNGSNPVFDESFEFQVNIAELASIRFLVLDDESIGDDFIGQYTIPFECMRTGYRHIRLKNNLGIEIPNAFLFVHITITNKPGERKMSRRGVSSLKRKNRRKLYPTFKKIGFTQVDETFKTAVAPLRDAADLRMNLGDSLNGFREACGLSPIANMKQCVRALATRASSAGVGLGSGPTPGSPSHVARLRMLMIEGLPHIEAGHGLPDPLRKAALAFGELVVHCQTVIRNAPTLNDKLQQSQMTGMEFYENLTEMCEAVGLKARKASRVTESFTWNIRLLMGQGDLLNRAKQEALECVQQAEEAGQATGLLPMEPPASPQSTEPVAPLADVDTERL